MRHLLRALCVVVLIPCCLRAEPPLLPKAFDVAAIDAYVAGQVKEKGYVGLQLAIMKDGKVVLAKGYGQRSIEPSAPVDENTAFRIGSITKQFTCAAILLLAEEGKLAVSDKVSRYFPSLTKAGDITLLDLMNHVSGYPDYYPLDFADRRMMKDIALDQLAKEYAGGKLDFDPGTRYSYSNTGYMLLGDIAEKASGEPLGKFLDKRIFQPLKMEHTRYLDARDLKNKATGYWSFALGPPEKALLEPDGWIAGAGGLWMSAPDLLAWNLALVSGKVLKPESYRLMTSARELVSGRYSQYGCGLVLGQYDGNRTLGHSGGVFGFISNTVVAPRTRTSVVLFSNCEHVSPFKLFSSIADLALRDESAKPAPAVPKIDGPAPRKVVLDFFHDLQNGTIDRSKLGEEFSVFMSDERVQAAAPRLKALGEPERILVGGASERGGMESLVVTLHFKDKTVKASLYRTPDGKIQQLLFSSE